MRKNGFTLIEIMVVVAIIVILIAILIPVLGSAKRTALRGTAEAQLNVLVQSIDAYFTVFHAYPGPAPTDYTNGRISSAKLSGSQNLALGVTYGMYATSPNIDAANAILPFPGPNNGSPWYSDPNAPTHGPTNFGNIRPDGTPEQVGAFYEPTPKQVSLPSDTNKKKWVASGVAGAIPNNFNFPVFVDSFPDPLPILYYRRSPGIETPVSPDASVVTGSYYWGDNSEYTSATDLVSSSGAVCSQAGSSMFVKEKGAVEMQYRVRNDAVNGGTSVHGGYMLISAGLDRIYGTSNGIPSGQGGAKVSDDITRVGGN